MEEKNKLGFQTLAAQAAANRPQGKQINVSQVVVVQPPRREQLDISKNSNAVRSADRGKRSALYDIYDNIIKDPVIGESIRKRVRHITNGGLKFLDKDKNEVPELTDLVNSPQGRIMLREILLARFYGKSVIELFFEDPFRIYKVPRKNLDTNKKVILKSTMDSDGIPYENNDFLLNIGEDDDLGLLMESAPFAIFKRNGGADYAEFCELWGIDILAALYDPNDEKGKEEMENTMLKRGSGGSIVASKNSDVKPIGTSKNGAIHKDFLDWLDDQILIGLIGQTMTSKNGSSLSQSKTHAEVEDDINVDDRAYVLEILNGQFLTALEKRGYPVKEGWFIFPEKDNLSLTDKLDIALKVDNQTLEGVSDDYFYETFGLPKGNKQKEQNPTPDPNNPTPDPNNPDPKNPANDPGKKTDPPGKKVTAKKLSLYDKVMDFFVHAHR